MSFLKEYGFDDVDIDEFLNNTPPKIVDVLTKNEALIRENLKFISEFGINTYKEIFINFPDMFLMDASNFAKMFTQYEKDELVEKLNNNFKMAKYL